ncbi:NAD(P)-binding protein [Mycena galericulata]|nr:NAD(P)-binding protein [Mycena galericulata]
MAPKKFNPARDIPDLSDKVYSIPFASKVFFLTNHFAKIIIVTGGNIGIGYETVKALLLKNATVYLAARSPAKGNAAITELETETKKRAKLLELDLADLKSVRRAAEAFLARESRLDILFNNGGVMSPPVDQLTAQGYDLQFGTNTLGHFFLTELLLPALTESHAHFSAPARIIHTSSTGHILTPKRDIFFDAVKGGPARDALAKKWDGIWYVFFAALPKSRLPSILAHASRRKFYGASKLGNIIVSDYYAQNHSDILVSCSLHPGLIRSGLQRHGNRIFKFLTGLAFSPTHVGAYNQLWAATTASAQEVNGKYFLPVGVAKPPGGITGDKELAADVIAYLKEAVKEF